MATIKGLWLFNDTLDVSTIATWSVKWYSLIGSKPSGNTIKIYSTSSGIALGFFNGSSHNFTVYYAKTGWNSGYKGYVTPISFGETDQTVSDDFYNWLIANATKYATRIKRADAITVVEAGQTATIDCGGRKVLADIVVEFTDDGVITYNGVETAVLAGQTATLPCAGLKMKTDVVVTVGQ